MIPFTYLIGWSKQNIFYYGVRYSKNCKPSDLWTRYFTSSKYVSEQRVNLGEPDIIQVRRTFTDKLAAKTWEHTVLRRMCIPTDARFLNRDDGRCLLKNVGKPLSTEHKLVIGARFRGKSQTEEQILKRSKAWIGRKHTTESKIKMRISHTGKSMPKRGPLTEEHKAKLVAWNAEHKPSVGLKRSDETLQKMREVNQGANNPNFGKTWWTNGSESKMLIECPPGWIKGRAIKRS